jgi:hypothetical protein
MSKVSQEEVDALLEEIHEHIPDFKIVYKEDKGWWKTNIYTFFAWLFFVVMGFFNPAYEKKFYKRYSNGMQGNVIVFPNRRDYEDMTQVNVYKLMRHEYVHLRDQQNHPLWWPISYVLVLPFVFTMRAHWEFRGYQASLLTHYELNGEIPDWLLDHYQWQFTSGMYGWMMPFKKKVRARLEQMRDDIYAGKITGYFWE